MLRSKPQRNSAQRKPSTSPNTTKRAKTGLKRSKPLHTTKRKLSTHHQPSPNSILPPPPQTLDEFIASNPPLQVPERFELPTGEAKTTNELRSSFLDFFKSHGHAHFSSSSVVPTSDPTLLFTSAGMVPFKNVFLGIEQPPNGHTRVTTAQRCVRAGGKHNDLDNVGYTARHHTYFEMLGNFSFGDYFKEEAIYFAWEYLTKTLKLPKSKLMVSVFDTDDEAAQLWAKISGFSESNGTIRRMGAEDNFWQMGDTGPCGPCSEIYFDQGMEVDGEQFLEIWNLVFMQFNRQEDGEMKELAKKCVDTGMGLERLAAVVQGVHNNFDNDTFLPLINKIGSTAQFHNGWRVQEPGSGIVDQHGNVVKGQNGSEESTNQPTTTTTTTTSSNTSASLDLSSTPLTHHQRLTATRVITDHMRSILAMLYDGVQPGSSGRGYVLRRIIRRACRYGLNLGYSAPFMYQHVDDVLKGMEEAVPGISAAKRQLRADLFQEEKIFSSSLNKGIRIIKDYITREVQNGIEGVEAEAGVSDNDLDKQMEGAVHQQEQQDGQTSSTTPKTPVKRQFPVDLAFTLYDAHGFPIDLTELCVQEYGWELDTKAVEQLLENRKAKSRELAKLFAKSANTDSSSSGVKLTQKIIDSVFDMWRTDGLSSDFVGYEKTFVTRARVLDIQPLGEMLRSNPNSNTNTANSNSTPDSTTTIPPSLGKRQVVLALNECPFYPTGGGQSSDTGNVTIRFPRTLLPLDLQPTTTNDFETITIEIQNAIKDTKGSTILLAGEFDEHPVINSDLLIQLLKEHELASQTASNPPFNRLFITASVDADIREQTSIHHTATHLLQAALQQVLKSPVTEIGDHHSHLNSQGRDDPTSGSTVKQAGSQVEHKNLRFDFGFPRPLTPAEVNAVEDRINAIALRRIPVNVAEMSFDSAKAMGAMALFGEKYGSQVRVISIPESRHHHHHNHRHRRHLNRSHEDLEDHLHNEQFGVDGAHKGQQSNGAHAHGASNHNNGGNNLFSVELCGGTHVENTGDCYPFVILSESGVSSGTRRIEAIAGPMAAQHLAQQHRALKVLKHDQVLRLHHLADTDEIIANTIKLKAKGDGAAAKVKELEKEKLAALFGSPNTADSSKSRENANSALQDVNPLLASFWHQPNGVSLSVVLPRIGIDGNDQGQLNHRAPIVMLYNVKPSLSSDYAVYRKFTEDLFLQQSSKHAKFMTAQAFNTHQSVAHVFIGQDNGKALVYSNIPASCTKKGGDASVISAHGGKHLTSNDVWKSISSILTKSKGGGNMSLAQGTFDFSHSVDTLDDGGVAQQLMTGPNSTPEDRLRGLGHALEPMLTESCKF